MSLPPTPRGAERDDPVRNFPPSELRRARRAGFVETALENFDMVIHSTATATVFNQVFFLIVTPATGCVAGCGAYAVGFVTRPRRGLFLSRFGDRLGRKSVMVATLNLMGSATLTMGLLPACTQVGLLAPRLLVLCRFGQGFGAGAEMAGVVVLLTEFASRGERGSSTSMAWIGAPVGFIAAALIWIAVQQRVLQEALVTYGWRVLFLSSVCVTLAAYLIRRKTKESPVFAEVQQESETEAGSPLREVFLHGRRPLRRVFFINIESHAHSYIYHAFVGALAHRHGPDRAGADAQDGALGRSLRRSGAFIVGWASDRWGRKPVNIAILLVLLVFSAPAFLLLNTGDAWLIALVCAVGFVFAVEGRSPHCPRCSQSRSGPATGSPASPWPGNASPSSAVALPR